MGLKLHARLIPLRKLHYFPKQKTHFIRRNTMFFLNLNGEREIESSCNIFNNNYSTQTPLNCWSELIQSTNYCHFFVLEENFYDLFEFKIDYLHLFNEYTEKMTNPRNKNSTITNIFQSSRLQCARFSAVRSRRMRTKRMFVFK